MNWASDMTPSEKLNCRSGCMISVGGAVSTSERRCEAIPALQSEVAALEAEFNNI